jgi:hypothetical protein
MRKHWATTKLPGVLLSIAVFMAATILFAHKVAPAGVAGTFRTTDLVVDNSAITGTITVETGTGQAALFSTPRAASTDGDNLCIGGGCQLVAYDGVNAFSGSTNHSFGIGALSSVTTGNATIALGHNALHSFTTGEGVVAVGNSAGFGMTTGFDNVCVGGSSCFGFTTASDNTAVGRSAMQGDGVNPTTGQHNTALGVNAMGGAATTAADNVAVGLDSLVAITTGFQNTCEGIESCALVNTGDSNTIIGSHAMENATSGFRNTGVGAIALRDVTIGDHNIALGRSSGGGITTGESNLILGSVTNLPAALTSWILIGDGDGNIHQTQDAHGVLSIGTADGTTFSTAHLVQISPRAPASVSHGTLTATSTDYSGTITGIGANTSVVLTFTGPAGAGFITASSCTANAVGGTPQFVTVTNSATAPTFSCFAAATGAAANCVDLNYACPGMQ